MKIRKARKEDVRKISLLVRRTLKKVNYLDYSDVYLNYLLDENKIASILETMKKKEFFCCFDKGNLLGVINLEIEETKEGQISGLYVKSTYLGHGYGKDLVDFVEKRAKKKGVKKMILYPTKSAEKFYMRLGYHYSGESIIWKMGNKKIKVLKMEKKLK